MIEKLILEFKKHLFLTYLKDIQFIEVFEFSIQYMNLFIFNYSMFFLQKQVRFSKAKNLLNITQIIKVLLFGNRYLLVLFLHF